MLCIVCITEMVDTVLFLTLPPHMQSLFSLTLSPSVLTLSLSLSPLSLIHQQVPKKPLHQCGKGCYQLKLNLAMTLEDTQYKAVILARARRLVMKKQGI